MAQQEKFTGSTISEITRESLADWATQLKAYNAVPLVLIAIGHDSGEWVICASSEVNTAARIAEVLLRAALNTLADANNATVQRD